MIFLPAPFIEMGVAPQKRKIFIKGFRGTADAKFGHKLKVKSVIDDRYCLKNVYCSALVHPSVMLPFVGFGQLRLKGRVIVVYRVWSLLTADQSNGQPPESRFKASMVW